MSVFRNLQSVFDGKIFLVALLVCMGSAELTGQTVINDNVINEYVSVDVMYTYESSDKDSVVVADASAFSKDDIVMLYQPKGFQVDTVNFNPLISFVSADIGEYAFLVIERIEGNTIIFNNSTDFGVTKDYTVSQLIKVAVYDSALVKSTITAPPWDSATGTGGVVAMYVKGRLQLGADIDVTGKGFKGAIPNPTDTYSGGCYGNDIRFRKRYYPTNAYDTAGLKGEGVVERNISYARGKGRVMNGGGGGNASYAGGGGGGNFFGGGDGYGQSSLCSDPNGDEAAGEGGYGLQGLSVYANTGSRPNRIFFGGGGGTGVYDAGGLKSSPGGDGGGIVVIVADEIYSDNKGGIYADGMSVTEVSEGAGGGGGAGGCIVLDANKFTGQVKLSATGGFGGSTVNGGIVTGPGGGGAGGVYWLRYYDSNVVDTVDNSPSNEGVTDVTTRAQPGGETRLLSDLEVPLRGFLFNTLPPNDTVCSDVIPAPIEASLPKGGVKPYAYKWIQSPNGVDNWIDATEVNDQMEYTFTNELTATTYFRRIVTDAGVLIDTSTVFMYHVVPAITGNLIAAPDTIACYGQSGIAIFPAALLSGAETASDTTFLWEKNIDGAGWVAADNLNDERDYLTSQLFDTTRFRRVVTSAKVCTSYSNVIRINTIDPVENNTIPSGDTICHGQAPGIILGGLPSGGDYANLWYDWGENKGPLATSSFDTVGVETQHLDYSDSVFFTEDDRYFRRIVYAGEDSSCVSVSDTFHLVVLDPLANNIITTPDTLICEDSLFAGGVMGLAAVGGDGAYSYQWQTSLDNANWITRLNTAENVPLGIPSYGQTTFVRRVVISGADSVCADTSVVRTLNVMPRIENNILWSSDTIVCLNNATSLELNGSLVQGGAGPGEYGYKWISSPDGISWSDFSGGNAEDTTGIALDATTYFRRVAWSDKTDRTCVDTSSQVLTYTIPDSIANNIIYDGITYDEICMGDILNIDGEVPVGGYEQDILEFTWQFGSALDALDSIDGGQDYNDISITEETFFRRKVYDSICISYSNPLQVYVRKLPDASMERTSDPEVCQDEERNTVQLAVNMTGGPDPNATQYAVTFGWETDDGDSDSLLVADISAVAGVELGHSPLVAPGDPDGKSTYTYSLLQIEDDNGCISRSHVNTKNIVIVQKGPEAGILNPQDPAFVCGPAIELEADPDLVGGEGGWIMEGYTDLEVLATFSNDTNSIESQAQITFEADEESRNVRYGWRRVAWNTPLQCGDTAWVEVLHYRDPLQANTLTPDTTVIFADTVLLRAELPLAGSGYWIMPDPTKGSLSDALSLHTVVRDLNLNDTAVIEWIIYNGITPGQDTVCGPYSTSLFVTVDDLEFFDGFSPGVSPGFNDGFAVVGLEHAYSVYCYIYNSWGVVVRTIIHDPEYPGERRMDLDYLGSVENDENREVQVLWDGRGDPVYASDGTGAFASEGEILDDGVYYFKLIIKRFPGEGEIEPYNGRIILKSSE